MPSLAFPIPRHLPSPLRSAFAVALLLAVSGSPLLALDPISTGLFSDLALGGHDPVAYFTDGEPVEGRADLSTEWKGATWRFASEEHREAFRKDPGKYAPAYGGYCAWAVSRNDTAPGDPRFWKIVDGRLFLNYSRKIQERWEKDVPGNVASADRNWPGLLGAGHGEGERP